MRNRPRCIEPLYEKLTSLGFNDSNIYTKETDMPASFQTEALETRKRQRTEQKKEHDGAIQEEVLKADASIDMQGLPLDAVPMKVQTIADLTLPALRDNILGRLSSNISASSLRALKGEAASKQTLLRILEFSCGLPPDYPLTGAAKCYNRHRERPHEAEGQPVHALDTAGGLGRAGLGHAQGCRRRPRDGCGVSPLHRRGGYHQARRLAPL